MDIGSINFAVNALNQIFYGDSQQYKLDWKKERPSQSYILNHWSDYTSAQSHNVLSVCIPHRYGFHLQSILGRDWLFMPILIASETLPDTTHQLSHRHIVCVRCQNAQNENTVIAQIVHDEVGCILSTILRFKNKINSLDLIIILEREKGNH